MGGKRALNRYQYKSKDQRTPAIKRFVDNLAGPQSLKNDESDTE